MSTNTTTTVATRDGDPLETVDEVVTIDQATGSTLARYPVAGTEEAAVAAAGNAVILKPSQLTPGVGEWLARSWRRSVPDLPEVFQNLVGFAATGQALTSSGVDKVAFTGSVRSGRAVAAASAPTLTPLLLELGGKDPVIVAEDADLDEAPPRISPGARCRTPARAASAWRSRTSWTPSTTRWWRRSPPWPSRCTPVATRTP